MNSLIRTVAEPAGDTATGGTRIDHGLDTDRSGALNDAEVQGLLFVMGLRVSRADVA